MTNLKARAAAARVGHFTSLFENPEVTAMAAICDLLQDLPDDAARLRVMRWSFGRFCPEFKRPLPADAATIEPPALALAPAPAPVATAASAAAPRRAEAAAPAMPSTTMLSEIAAVAPDLTASQPPADTRDDFGSQISELREMFGSDARRPIRAAFADAF